MRTLTALLTAFLLVLTSSLYTQNDFKLGFTGAYPQYYDYNTTKNINWQNYHDMSMNQWQGWWIGDNWRRTSSNTTAVEDVLSKLSQEHIDGWFQPDTILWAGYGRVQVNEAEEISDRFNYGNHRCGSNYLDNTQFGSNQYVRYFNKNDQCNEEQSPEGLVLWNVKEKGFQSFSGLAYDPVYQATFPYNNYNGYSRDTTYINRYYIKPRMRVEVNDVNNGPDKRVVRIIVNKFNGQLADSLTIFTSDFKNSQGNYDGRYIEDYFLYNLSIPADILNSIGEPNGRISNTPLEYLKDCHVDYQVYWYGEVSVWIDYVKVMDEAAYMFNNPDPCKSWRTWYLLQNL